ncbi:Eukaryotic translation initiation factor [Drechslerella dactyloides]|uniref:Eukaryotic translation initiation factor n=1 Tax=Drechslerella dactyloides TaxID=74499 RepID=A0AAD6IWA3_DREDA|nr:Eukaryotic translation initiation factor [Drechslerella dactyloides]
MAPVIDIAACCSRGGRCDENGRFAGDKRQALHATFLGRRLRCAQNFDGKKKKLACEIGNSPSNSCSCNYQPRQTTDDRRRPPSAARLHVTPTIYHLLPPSTRLRRHRRRYSIPDAVVRQPIDHMASTVNTLLVEGSFDDQVLELAEYFDTLKGGDPTLLPELTPLLEKGEKEDVMEKLVEASSVLSQAPEKEYIPAYNLLVHLIRTSPLLPSLLDTVTANLSVPLKNSTNGAVLSLAILTTIFNVLSPESSLRSEVFRSIVKIVEENNLYETLKPQLKSLDRWLLEWDSGVEDTRDVLVLLANVAEKAGDNQFYDFLVQALQRFPVDEADEDEARELAIRAVKAAITLPHHMEFSDLTTLEPVKALSATDPEFYSFFEIFAGGEFQDLEEFKEEHDGWLEENGTTTPSSPSYLITVV